MKPGPEKELVDHYIAQAARIGRQHALSPISVEECDERKSPDQRTQSDRLIASVPPDAVAIALDERGDALTSPEFAALLARERDRGCSEIVFLIGGADGHSEALRQSVPRRISFGSMVWPHMLARVMLAEQIYRACSILAGTPYHRA